MPLVAFSAIFDLIWRDARDARDAHDASPVFFVFFFSLWRRVCLFEEIDKISKGHPAHLLQTISINLHLILLTYSFSFVVIGFNRDAVPRYRSARRPFSIAIIRQNIHNEILIKITINYQLLNNILDKFETD